MDFVKCNACQRLFSDERCLRIHISKEHTEEVNITAVPMSFDDFSRVIPKKRKWRTGRETVDSGDTATNNPGDESQVFFVDEQQKEYEEELEQEDDVEEEEEEDDVEEEEEEDDNPEEEEDEEEDDEDDHDDIQGKLRSNTKDMVPTEMNNLNDFVQAMNLYETEKSVLPPMPMEMQAGIELLSMIRQSNASMQLYSKVVKWTDQYYIKSQKVQKPPPREGVIKFLASRYKLHCLMPCQTVCRLPSSNLLFNVVRHRFFACLFSLLTDKALMRPENLIFKNDANFPAAIDYSNPGVCGELHTGDAFNGYMKRIANPDKTVVFSLIIFGDGTVVDGAMRKSIEPYSFTLGIFRQHARAKPSAWRILSYVKNNTMCLFSPEKIKEANAFQAAHFVSEKNPAFVPFNKRDCHAQLSIGLQDIKDIQNFCTGMKFKLPWAPEHEKLYDWRFPVAFFMGDTPAHDKLCCLRNPNSACRMCNIQEDKFDNPTAPYRLRDTRALKKLLDEENYARVKAMGFYPCKDNILLHLEYLDERGMLMALPPESLHVILLGLVPRLIQGLSRARKVDKSSKTSRENEDKGKHYVFFRQVKKPNQGRID